MQPDGTQPDWVTCDRKGRSPVDFAPRLVVLKKKKGNQNNVPGHSNAEANKNSVNTLNENVSLFKIFNVLSL